MLDLFENSSTECLYFKKLRFIIIKKSLKNGDYGAIFELKSQFYKETRSHHMSPSKVGKTNIKDRRSR